MWTRLFPLLAVVFCSLLRPINLYGFIGSAEVSESYKPFLLKNALSGLEDKIESSLIGYEMGNVAFQPDVLQCTREQVKKLDKKDAWLTCPGIPDYFFRDGSYVPNLKPRPVRVEMNNIKIDRFDFGKIDVDCLQHKCKIRIPLDRLDVQLGFDLKTVWRSSHLNAGDSLLSAKNTKIEIKQNELGESPYLSIFISIDPTHSQQPIKVLTGSQIFLPFSSVQISLDEPLDSLTVQELFNYSGVLSIGSMSFSAFLGVASLFSGNASKLWNLISLDQTINEHFNDQDKIKAVNDTVKAFILPGVISSVNKVLSQQLESLFGESQIPVLSLQSIADLKFAVDLANLINDQIALGGDLFLWQENGKTISSLFAELDIIPRVHTVLIIKRIRKQLARYLASFTNNLLKEDEKEFVSSLVAKLDYMLADSSEGEPETVKMPAQLSLFKTEESPFGLGAMLFSESLQAGKSLVPLLDLRLRINLDFISLYFKNIFKHGNLGVCLVPQKLSTCYSQDHERIFLDLVEKPQIQMEEFGQSLIFQVRDQEHRVGFITLSYQFINEGNRLGFAVKATKSRELEGMNEFINLLANQITDLIKSVHPLMEKNIPGLNEPIEMGELNSWHGYISEHLIVDNLLMNGNTVEISIKIKKNR